MATKRQLETKQEYLETVKWLESEEKGTDTCGLYDYCQFCDKTKAYPCARAFYYAQTNKKE